MLVPASCVMVSSASALGCVDRLGDPEWRRACTRPTAAGWGKGAGLRARSVLVWGCALAALACASPGPGKSGADPEPETRLRALHEAGTPRRVVLVTLAGLEAADFLSPGAFAAKPGDPVRMPFLAELAAEGSFGVHAAPPTPGSSYASHATLVTGLRPKRHGIVAEEVLDPSGDRSVPYWDSRLLKATTLWDAALGRGVLALGWPSTDGARIELLVPDAAPDDPTQSWLAFVRRRSSPQLTEALEAIAKVQLAETPAGQSGEKRSAASWPSAGERDAAFVELACQVAASDRDPALWLLRLVEPAEALGAHGYGSREHRDALARADARLERLVDCLETSQRLIDTALFVSGDVSYRPVHTEIAANTALVREKLIGRDPRSKTGVRSWLALARSNGRSAYLYADNAQSALEARRVLEAEAVRSGAFDIVPAAELASQDADPQAWFGLAAHPGYGFGNALTGPLLRPSELRSRAGGFPFREGAESAVGFVAWGRGVRQEIRVPELSLTDVAPTIAKLLGLRLDDGLDGRPLVGILRASQPLPPPGPKRIGVGSDGDIERTLRELGGGHDLGSDR